MCKSCTELSIVWVVSLSPLCSSDREKILHAVMIQTACHQKLWRVRVFETAAAANEWPSANQEGKEECFFLLTEKQEYVHIKNFGKPPSI